MNLFVLPKYSSRLAMSWYRCAVVSALVLVSVLWNTAQAQAPANDDPCNAIELTPAETCTYQTFTNANATPASGGALPGIPAPGCASYTGGDVWFRVTVPAGGALIFDSQTGVITDGGMAIYSGTCDNLTLIECDDDDSPNGLMPYINRTDLVPGSTVWVRFWEYGGNNNGTFGICVRIPPAAPTNDNPCTAIALTVEQTCTYQTFTNESATGTTGVPAPGCAGYTGGDVWFTVTVPAGGIFYVDTDEGVMTDGGMAIYSGTCDNLTLVSCDDNTSPNGNMPKLTVTGQTPGATLWVRVWENGNNNNGTFGICVSIPPPPPANDDPCNAIELTPSTTCTYQTFTNENATASTGVPAPGCASYQGGDVWFQVTVPAGGQLIFDTQTGQITDGGMAIYSGTCDNLTLISCDDDSSPNGAMSMITNNTLTPGSTIWIRVWEYGGDNNGTFGICVKIPPPPPTNDNACNATPLTVEPTCTYQTFTNENATSSTTAPSPSCGGYSGGDVWFSVVVPADGSLLIDTDEGVMTDGAMAVYSGTCDNLTQLACDDNTSANGNMPKIVLTGQTPGATLWIRVWENGNNNNGTFGICITSPPPPPANDNQCTATLLTAETACNFQSFTTVDATGSTGVSAPTCGTYTGFDVWFRVVVPAGGAIKIDTRRGTMLDGGMAVYRGGSCNTLTQIACDDNSSSSTNMPMLLLSGQTPGATLWIRVWGNNGDANIGTFDICVQIPPPPPANDNPCTATSLTPANTCNFQTFTNESSTGTTGVAAPTCGTYSGYDVWFTVTVPAGGAIDIDTRQGTMLDGGMAVYSGANCNSLTQIACDDNSSANTNMPFISLGGQTPGATLYIRVWGTSGLANVGTFGICVQIPPAQANAFNFACAKDITVGCGDANGCFSVSTVIPNIHSSTDTYEVNPMSGSGGCFAPYVNPGIPGSATNLTTDDVYTGVITLPFTFPFYGANYTSLVASTNGLVSFDITKATAFSHYSILNNGGTLSATAGNPQDLPSTLYDKAVIMGPYHDINPFYTTSPNRRIKYNVIGTAPHRKWVLSFYKVPLFDCQTLINNSHQIVLYEGTGIAEVFVFEKDTCMIWNKGRAMIGMQDMNRTRAIMVQGRKASDNPWGGLNLNESYRFTPASGPTLFKRVELLDTAGNIVATGDTTSINATNLGVTFNQVCLNTSDTIVTLIVRSVYAQFNNPNSELFGMDTIRVTRNARLNADYAVNRPTCSGLNNGSITVTPTNGQAPYEYSIDGGANYQNSNTFAVSAGTYTVRVRDSRNCIRDSVIQVLETAPVFGTYASNATRCNGGNDGTITVDGIVGTSPFEYAVDGSPFQQSGLFTLAGGVHVVTIRDANGCLKDTTVEVLQAPPIYGTYESTTPRCTSGNDGSITVNGIAGTGTSPFEYAIDGGTFQSVNVFTVGAGPHVVSIRDANGCVKDSTIDVLQPDPIYGDYQINNVRCAGGNNGSITVNGIAGTGTSPFEYAIDGGLYQSNNVFSVASGSHVVSIRDANGCTKDSTVTVIEPLAIISNVRADSVACFGGTNGTITINALNGTAPYTYSIDGINFQNSNSFTVPAGPYTVRIKDANDCLRDSVIQVYQPALLVANTASNNATCSATPNGQITVNPGGGTAPFEYSLGSGSFQTSNQFVVDQGSFTINVRDFKGCTTQTTASVGFTFDLTLRGRSDTSVCGNGGVQLTTVSNASSFTWTPATGLDNATIASPYATPATPTEYVVVARTGPCELRDTIRVAIAENAVVNAGQDITIIKGDNATLSASVENASSFTWSPITYLNNPSILNPVSERPQETTTYRLTVYNSIGCVSYDEVKVIVLPYCIKVKNAFSPNGDGINDAWVVYDQYDCLKNIRVSIFNRYGSKVFESKNYRNDWKGTYNGQSLPDATYYYVIEFELLDGRVQQVRGDVTILR